MKKKFLTLVVAMLLISTLAGCGNKQEDTKNNGSSNESAGSVIPDANDNPAVVEQDTDGDNDQNTQNMISVDDIAVGKYMLTNENDGVSLVYNEGNYVLNTYYYFTNNKLQSIEKSQRYKNKDMAQKAYETLSSDENVKKEYSSITIDDNVVYMLSNQNNVDPLKSLNQQELYNKLKSEHPDEIIK